MPTILVSMAAGALASAGVAAAAIPVIANVFVYAALTAAPLMPSALLKEGSAK